MVETTRTGIGRIAAAVVIIVIVLVAAGLGITLSSQGTHSTTSSHTTSSTTSTTTASSSSSTSSTTSTTTSSSQTSSSETSSSTSTTTSSSAVPVGCVFSPPGPLTINGSSTTFYTGCLTGGASGNFFFGVTDPNGVVVLGAIRGQFPINITIAGAPVGNLTAAGNGGIAFQANDTIGAGMPDLVLLASRGYGVTLTNVGDQNNTVTINLTYIDELTFAGG
jgi:hypothetical protein